MSYRIWFNKGFSGVYHLARALRVPLISLVSHTAPDAVALLGGAESFVEPADLVGRAYLEYCLEVCRDRHVDLFMPTKEVRLIAAHRKAFEAKGTRLLLAADSETLLLLDRKVEFLSGLDPEIVATTPFEVFSNLAEFDAALERLTTPGVRLCFKPSRGIYGHGFRILTERQSLEEISKGDTLNISLEQARQLFSDAQPFKPFLLMHYAEGPERSIDCLAYRGQLVQAVSRVKIGDTSQLLEDNPAILEIAARLTERYQLSGIFNVQLKEMNGVPLILEINARPSGGIFISMASGFNFIEWAVKLELGLCSVAEVPAPMRDLKVGRTEVALTTASLNPVKPEPVKLEPVKPDPALASV
jgi:hypothetical protein